MPDVLWGQQIDFACGSTLAGSSGAAVTRTWAAQDRLFKSGTARARLFPVSLLSAGSWHHHQHVVIVHHHHSKHYAALPTLGRYPLGCSDHCWLIFLVQSSCRDAENCHAGLSNWYHGWSHVKKSWCCVAPARLAWSVRCSPTTQGLTSTHDTSWPPAEIGSAVGLCSARQDHENLGCPGMAHGHWTSHTARAPTCLLRKIEDVGALQGQGTEFGLVCVWA